jgi:regulator of protease activity HflC (stomatin/prohibitin superfamily)
MARSKNEWNLENIKAEIGSALGENRAGGGRKTSGSAPRMEARQSGFNWMWALPIIFLALTLLRSFIVVGAGERAVVFNRLAGLQEGQLGEGLHFLLPWVQDTTVYDIKTHTYTMSGASNEGNQSVGNANDALEALTADGLPVWLEMSVQFHPDQDNVWKLHREIGPYYVEKIVRPQVRSHVRMIVSQYPVVDVYGGRRAQIIEQINNRLRRLFAQNHLVLENALLRDVSFSQQFQQAIEQKQVAQQEVQRMTFVVQQADKERRRKIIEAEGEAASIRLKADALAKNPQLVQWEYVKNLPQDVKTVVTDGRTIINIGDAATATRTPSAATNAVAAEPEATTGP